MATETFLSPATKTRLSYWAAGVSAVFLAAMLFWAVSDRSPDDGAACTKALDTRLFGTPDLDSSAVYWTDGPDADTRVMNGTVHSGGDTFAFSCGVRGGDVAWLDLK